MCECVYMCTCEYVSMHIYARLKSAFLPMAISDHSWHSFRVPKPCQGSQYSKSLDNAKSVETWTLSTAWTMSTARTISTMPTTRGCTPRKYNVYGPRGTAGSPSTISCTDGGLGSPNTASKQDAEIARYKRLVSAPPQSSQASRPIRHSFHPTPPSHSHPTPRAHWDTFGTIL